MTTTKRTDRLNTDPDLSWPAETDPNFDPATVRIVGIHVNARRWFQRSYGNTYHTVSAVVTYVNERDETWQVTVGPSGVTYGYGEYYVHTVGVMLEGAGLYIDNPYDDPYDVRRDHRDVWTEDVADVPRKGDLH